MAEETNNQAAAAKGDNAQGDNLPENSVTIEDAGLLRKKVTVKVPQERIDAKREEMFGELHDAVQVPGFRIGHAPRRLIEKRFGREVTHDVRNALVGESLGQAIEKSDLQVLGEPDLDLENVELPESGDLEFTFEVEVAPEFELPEAKGIRVEKIAYQVTEERIDAYIDELRQARATHEPTEDPAADGDLVNISARISIAGGETVQRDNLSLRVAPGQIEGLPLVNLGAELTGKKAGETAELKITVPGAHPNEDWKNKEASVDITVKEVRKAVLPEGGEAFAKQAGFETLDEFRGFVRNRMELRLASETKRHMREQVSQFLLDNTDFDLPEGAAARHSEQVLQRRYVDLMRQGVPRERIDENLTRLQAAADEQAKRELRLQFILDKVAEARNIEVTEEDINSVIASMAGQYERRPERLRQELASAGTLEQLRMSMREDAALDKLLEQAEVVEVSPAEAEGQPDKDAKDQKSKARKTAKKSAKKTVKKTEKNSAGKTAGKSVRKSAGKPPKHSQ
ncbi:MAG: trigger factor [Phycisphaerae bacterium]|jgi:trigger factor|nr:trigger factor [Phycisphaerae bacterium]